MASRAPSEFGFYERARARARAPRAYITVRYNIKSTGNRTKSALFRINLRFRCYYFDYCTGEPRVVATYGTARSGTNDVLLL